MPICLAVSTPAFLGRVARNRTPELALSADGVGCDKRPSALIRELNMASWVELLERGRPPQRRTTLPCSEDQRFGRTPPRWPRLCTPRALSGLLDKE
jgi:hypothetical protein